MVKDYLMKAQSRLVYAVEAVCLALFVLYLGFMTHFYVLFYDGTLEMFEYYKKLQVFDKEAFSFALVFVGLALALLVFELHKYRPGLLGLVLTLGASVYMALNSISLLQVLPKYKHGYLALDFSSLENYIPSAFVFDAGLVLHYTLIGLLISFAAVATITFVQRLKDGNPLIRKLI